MSLCLILDNKLYMNSCPKYIFCGFMRKDYLVVTAAATIAAALLLLVVFVNSQAQMPLQLQRTATMEREGIQLRVEADKEIYGMGELVQFKIFQKNLRNEPVSPAISYVEVIIRDSSGQVVRGPYASTLDFWTSDQKIMPTQETQIGTDIPPPWSQTDNNGQQVATGTYTIKINVDEDTVELKIMIAG
jgi:hypothetical protein